MAAGIWVATLLISARTAEKLSQKHGLGAQEVRAAVVCVEGLNFSWNDDPDRGLRAIVSARIRRRRVLVVLYPVDDPLGDAWHLGSAYFA